MADWNRRTKGFKLLYYGVYFSNAHIIGAWSWKMSMNMYIRGSAIGIPRTLNLLCIQKCWKCSVFTNNYVLWFGDPKTVVATHFQFLECEEQQGEKVWMDGKFDLMKKDWKRSKPRLAAQDWLKHKSDAKESFDSEFKKVEERERTILSTLSIYSLFKVNKKSWQKKQKCTWKLILSC